MLRTARAFVSISSNHQRAAAVAFMGNGNSFLTPRHSQRHAIAWMSASTCLEKNKRPYQLVIVESPSKCKTISKILEKYAQQQELDFDYRVESTVGHVRDLPKQASKGEVIAGVDLDQNYKPTYEILKEKRKVVSELSSLATKAQKVILATDEDREGEAMAWHVLELLPPNVNYARVTFLEITSKAIVDAILHERKKLDMNLVEAQETRRILDRLAGYSVSPILWKKIAPGLSAGRVQSVGMALVVQRERMRLAHVEVQYWDLKGMFDTSGGETLQATMVALNGVPLAVGGDFDNSGELIRSDREHLDENGANDTLTTFAGGGDSPWIRDPTISDWTVTQVKSTQRSQSPPMPFTTSTLQQESSKRLGMSVSQTMRTSQSLYEDGFISYMRTDSHHLSQDAHEAIEQVITKDYGSVQTRPPRNTTKASKNAQEAHEAIRPAVQEDGSFLHPDLLSSSNPSAKALYELIYQRTLASRMGPVLMNQTLVDITGTSPDGDTAALFRVSGSYVLSPGYTLAWKRSLDDTILPPLVEGQKLDCTDLEAVSHATQPPPRYTEASFVKELEALGVGRPSTYARIIQILRDRAYVGSPVRADANGQSRNAKQFSGPAASAQRAAGGQEFTGGGRGPLVPSLSAFVVCSLLEKNFPNYVDPDFTADMEERLDRIAQGVDSEEDRRLAYLDEFYAGEDGLAAQVKRMEQQVVADDARRADLPGLFSNNTDDDEIGLFIGPWGPYVKKVSLEESLTDEKPTTAQLPSGMAADISLINQKTLRALLASRERDGLLLGSHPDDGREIRLKIGKFGAYLQWGKYGDEGTTTHSLPKRIGSMRNLDYEAVDDDGDSAASLGAMIGLTLEDAVGYVGLPRTVCNLNELPIVASIGPYGPYLKYNNSFVSLREEDGDVLNVTQDVAERVVTDRIINKSSKFGKGVLAELGEKDGSMVKIKEGRYGRYINWKRVNAKLPAEFEENPEEAPLELAWQLIQEKAPSSNNKKRSKKAAADDDHLKLPPAPKRPLSAYHHFCAEKRPEIMKSVKSLGGVSKELSRLWADTAPETGNGEQRTKYEDLAAESKKKYEEQKKAWQQECKQVMEAANAGGKVAKKNGVKQGKGKKSSSKLGKASMPKKPLSSYLHFCAAKRPEVSKSVKTLGDISKELARLWKETEADGGEGRKEYEELAAADKVRYEEEMMHYNNGVPKKGKTTRKKKGEAQSKPQRAPSAYMLFCSEHRQSIVNESGEKLPFGETTKKLAKMWRECDEATRASFEAEAYKKKQQLVQS